MQKLVLEGGVILVLAGFLMPPAFAQSVFGFEFGSQKQATPAPPPPSGPARPNQVMSQEEFINSVNTQSQKAQNAVTQQLNDQLAKQPPPAAAPPPVANTATSVTNTSTVTTATPSVTQPMTSGSPQTPGAPPMTTLSAPPSVAPPTTNYSVTASPPSGGTSAPAQQSGIYSGFGTGSTTTNTNTSTTNPSSGNNTGGWNIKY